jgi:hypothetical protein
LYVDDNANVIKGHLSAGDPFDRLRKGCHARVYAVPLKAGRHVIDLTSGDGKPGPSNPGFFDTYLRIEDGQGNVLAENDDHGGTFNSQVTLQVARPGEYRIVVTSYPQGATGDFELRIR